MFFSLLIGLLYIFCDYVVFLVTSYTHFGIATV